MKNGRVSLVGAGCGAPDFLTLRAQRRLNACEVLVYDSLVSEQILEQAPADCEKIYAGKRYGRHAMKQEEINALLIRKAQEGKRVVRLKGGDPYVFGRGGEEFLALMEAGVDCEEIPGITSSIAVPAAAGIPVTHRGLSRSFTVVTGSTAGADNAEAPEMDYATLAKLEGTLVILMGVHSLRAIADGLMEAGKDPGTPCAIIMEGTLAGQKCVRAPLSDIAARSEAEGIRQPAVIVIGAVAQLRLLPLAQDVQNRKAVCDEAACGKTTCEEKTCGEATCAETPCAEVAYGETAYSEAACGDAAEKRKRLSGVTVGVTGTPRFAEKLSRALRLAGAAVCDMSFMEILENPVPLPQLCKFGWLVFTSPNGVRIFLDKMKREKRDLRSIARNKIAVIGPGTAGALAEAGLYADYMPQRYNVRQLAEGLLQRMSGEKESAPALFLRSETGSRELPELFAQNGIAFTEFPLYEIGIDEAKRRQAMGKTPDYLAFGSGSGVRAWFEGEEQGGRAAQNSIRYVCMGEACGATLAQLGKRDFLVARESSVSGIVACICEDAKSRSGKGGAEGK